MNTIIRNIKGFLLLSFKNYVRYYFSLGTNTCWQVNLIKTNLIKFVKSVD